MREYEIEFTNGTHEKYQANVIAENMYAQVNDEGNEFLLLDTSRDARKNSFETHTIHPHVHRILIPT